MNSATLTPKANGLSCGEPKFSLFISRTAAAAIRPMMEMVGPSVGVTLPLLSAGGSSVLSAYLGLGLVLAVRHSEKTTMFS